jgi:hypothetical protein
MIPTASTLLAAAPIFLWPQLLPSVHASNAAGTTVIVTATPTIPHPPSYTSPEIFKDVVLSASNTYRRDHNASQLSWNETLTTYAKHWAEGCKWKHSVSLIAPIPIKRTFRIQLISPGGPVRREHRLRLLRPDSRRLGLGRRRPEIQLQATDRIQRRNGAFHAVGLEGDEGGRVRGVQLRV